MTVSQLLVFASIYAVFVITPGPGVAAVVARGLSQGIAAAPAYIAGFVLGDVLWFIIAASGLQAMAMAFGVFFVVLKYAGCAYLLYMAWAIWTAPLGDGDVAASGGRQGWAASFASSLTIALGNPKVIVFFLSIMPLAVDVQHLAAADWTKMIAVIVAVFAPLQFGVLFLAHRARAIFRSANALRRMNRTASGVMAGTAVAIAARG